MAHSEPMTKEIDALMHRFKAIYPKSQNTVPPIAEVERILNIHFPYDWERIAHFYKGEMLGPYWTYAPNVKGPGSNIVEANLEYRKLFKLPNKYIILNEPDISLILLETQKTPEELAPVFIIDPCDLERFLHCKPLQFPQIKFKSFIDFFEYLLDQEEKERKEKDPGMRSYH